MSPPFWYGGYPPHHAPVFIQGARFRFFPRLFWFALGAGAFSFWSARREERQRAFASVSGAQAEGHNGEWRQWSSSHWACPRRRQQQLQDQQQRWTAAGSVPPPQGPAVSATVAPPPLPAPVGAPAQSPAPAYSPSAPGPNPVEWQAERFREVSRQATDTVTEMSEQALDTLMTNLQTLKAKIVQNREARQKERNYIEQRDKQDPRDSSPPPGLV